MSTNPTLITAPALPRVAILNNRIFREVDRGLYTGWEPVTQYEVIEATKMSAKWKGTKIPWALWEQIVSFMRWSQATHKAEALITFYYNKTAKEWKAWPFPQEPRGMTVCYETTNLLYEQDRRMFGNDWIQLGSLHHHCTANAFASSTDKTDEEDRDGVHITLGKMEDTFLDLHIRQVFGSITYDANIFDWLEMPDWVACIPNHLRWKLFNEALRSIPATVEFEPEWKNRIIPKKSWRETTTYPNHAGGSGTAVGKNSASCTNWKLGRRHALRQICDDLKISVDKADRLLTEINYSTMSHEDLTLRNELAAKCLQASCPSPWADEIFDEMAKEETEAAEHFAQGYLRGV